MDLMVQISSLDFHSDQERLSSPVSLLYQGIEISDAKLRIVRRREHLRPQLSAIHRLLLCPHARESLMMRYPHLPGPVPVLDPNAPGQRAAGFLDEVRARYGDKPRAPFAETWGQNHSGSGQSGNGSTPITLSRLSSVVTAVASGNCHCLAVRNGAVYAWGSNRCGQLGAGDTEERHRPVAVTGLSDGVTAISASSTHSLAIRHGAVYAWGSNETGQLGNGTIVPGSVPIPVPTLPGGVTAIAAGDYFSLAIWNGAVYAWGSNSSGSLGIVPLEVSLEPAEAVGMWNGVTAIAAGNSHCLAVRHGALYSWGGNAHGELGHGGKVMSVMPAKVRGFDNGVTAIAAGSRHSLVVCRGVVYTSGSDGFVPVAGLENIVAVAAGNDSNFALAADGSLWVWGSNLFGALGLGPGTGWTSRFDTPQHRLPPEGYKYLAVACADSHGIAILTALPEI
jgi:alpha-tubulin suppressor-like RCC1 family protein